MTDSNDIYIQLPFIEQILIIIPILCKLYKETEREREEESN